MKGLRRTAFGLAVVVCLLTTAPAAWAGPRDTAPARTDAGGWISGWLERIAEWLSWSDQPGPGESGGGRMRPVFEQDSCGIDPNGAPKPCPPGTGPEPEGGPGGPLGG